MFDKNNGLYIRSGVLDEKGVETDEEPFMSSFPHIIDVGVMGNCNHGKSGLCIKSGVECYQNGLNIAKPNMSVENFRKIAKECKGKVNQFALGGRGDVDQHDNFEELLKICKENDIVPNFTSSGLGFTDKIVDLCKRYCGAVAISWYRSEYTLRAIKMLVDKGIKTNIHYVLSNSTINEAIDILKSGKIVDGVNAIIFLLHKPIGLGSNKNTLKHSNPKVKEFFELVDTQTNFKIGFDSCSVPAILNFNKNIDLKSLDTCEGGRFSCYINSDMKMLPCSFDQDLRWIYDISNDTILNAWSSNQFEEFRLHLRKSCPKCSTRVHCMGGCPIDKSIVLCNKAEF